MTNRQQRRAAERRMQKLARRGQSPTENQAETNEQNDEPVIVPAQTRDAECTCADCVNDTDGEAHSPAGQLATPEQTRKGGGGPRSADGKVRSSANSLRHGLTGSFILLPSESQELYNELLDSLTDEHAPATPTEMILVEKMAQHLWLSRRAAALQQNGGDLKEFALMLRYATTHDRGFYRALNELRLMRRHQAEFVSQEVRVRLAEARAHSVEQETEIRGRIEAPIPGNAAIPFDLVKRFIGDGLKHAHHENQRLESRKSAKR